MNVDYISCWRMAPER